MAKIVNTMMVARTPIIIISSLVLSGGEVMVPGVGVEIIPELEDSEDSEVPSDECVECAPIDAVACDVEGSSDVSSSVPSMFIPKVVGVFCRDVVGVDVVAVVVATSEQLQQTILDIIN
jgi:hypothetical protein